MNGLQSQPTRPDAAPLTDDNATHKLIRERVWPPSEFERVLLLMHESRATGTLMLDISQGALCSIRFREEQKIK